MTGLTDATGDLGGIVYILIARYNGKDYANVFWIVGVANIAASLLVAWIRPVSKGQLKASWGCLCFWKIWSWPTQSSSLKGKSNKIWFNDHMWLGQSITLLKFFKSSRSHRTLFFYHQDAHSAEGRRLSHSRVTARISLLWFKRWEALSLITLWNHLILNPCLWVKSRHTRTIWKMAQKFLDSGRSRQLFKRDTIRVLSLKLGCYPE